MCSWLWVLVILTQVTLRYEVLYPTPFGAIFEVLRAKSALSASLGAYLQLLLELFTIRRVQPIIWF